MKNFVRENWYKLMIGSSMFIFSVGFLLYAISPSYANTNEEKILEKANTPRNIKYNPSGEYYFVDNGYFYEYIGDAPYSPKSWYKVKIPK